MRTAPTISALLGVSQNELAGLLQVSRSLISLYELGKRDLPAPAKILLADMLSQVRQGEADHLPKQASATSIALKIGALERLLRENTYQQEILGRKMARATAKQTARERLALLSGFLERNAVGKKSAKQQQQLLLRKTAKNQDDDLILMLQAGAIRQQVLAFEQTLLEARIKELQRES